MTDIALDNKNGSCRQTSAVENENFLKYGFFFLLFFVLMLGFTPPAQAEQFPCSSLPGGLLDGDVTPVPPANIKIDTNCRIQNYPNGLNTNFTFDNNDPTPYLVIFDNVLFVGQMSCNTVANHKIWFTNNSDTTLKASCQNILIPVEKIDKRNPVGQTTATIGVPFTYTMIIPVLFDPATGGIVTDGSVNDIGNIRVTDDLSLAGTGADLTLLNVIAYQEGTNTPVPINNIGGNNLDFILPDITAGDQIIVEVTVVLNDTAANVAGNTFINTAKWFFSRLIDGQLFEPLPGEWGVTQPLTIAEPDIVVTKTGNESVLNLGTQADFTIDVQNNGGSDAWNVTILDQLPDGATAGMCDFDPTIPGISARVFEADGTTPVSVQLIQGLDFSATYRNSSTGSPATRCQLELTMLTDRTVIGPTQRLIIVYKSELDFDTTAEGAVLINVAAATEWFGTDSSSNPRAYTRPLTDGTPGTTDHEDNYTITTTLSGYVFHKTVENLTTGANPTATAAPGDTLRYRVRLFNVDQNFTAITIFDQLDLARFDRFSFNLVNPPANAEFVYSNITGQLNVDGLGAADLNLPVGNEFVFEFDITLLPTLLNDDLVSNQADLTSLTVNALSDDPAGGIVTPPNPGEPTVVLIQSPGPLLKVNPASASVTIGERFTYTITVPEVPSLVPLYDVRILDDLSVSGADLNFISATVVNGGGWSLSNTGTATNLVIEDTVTGIDILANQQAVIEITVQMLNTTGNNIDDPFNNTAAYTYNRTNGISASQKPGAGVTTANMIVVEPDLTVVTKVGTPIIAAPIIGGSIIEYVISMTNGGTSTAFDVNVVDNLPAELALFAGFTPTISGIPDTGFIPLPTAGSLPGQLIWGRDNGDNALDIPAGATLVLTYQAQVQSSAVATFNNVAWIDWLSLENGGGAVRTGDGCPVAIVAPDDYCATATSASFVIDDNNSLSKIVFADSWATNGSTAGDATVRVGDTVTYQLTLNLGEGTTNSVTVSDVLPAGMVLESLATISPATGVSSFIYTLVAQPTVGDNGTLIWDLGDVVNTPSGDVTPIDSLVIEYTARVIENDASTIAQGPETTLPNTATLAYVDSAGVPVTDPSRLVSQASITVLQPVLSTPVKTGNGATNDVTSPLDVIVSTQIVSFQLMTCNTVVPAAPLAPAYNVLLIDDLFQATQLDETSLTTPVVRVNGTELGASDYIYTPPAGPPPAGRGGTIQIQLLVPLNPDECVTVDYDMGFHTDFPSTQTWNNSFTVEEYWSLPASSGQQYSPLGPAQFFMTNIIGLAPLSKIVTSPISGEITIGEEAVYTITIPAIPHNAALNNVVITDPLFSALTYVDASAVGNTFPMGNTSAGQNVNLTFAQIPSFEQITITLRTRLTNIAAAQEGISFTNTATYTSDNFPAIVAVSAALAIVEPDITINKSVSPVVPPNPGETLTYSLTFTASSGVDFSDAFDLSITDTLSAGLTYVTGSSVLDATPISDPTGGAGPILTWDDAVANIDVAEGDTVTLTYDVLVGAGVASGSLLSNSAFTEWTGLDGNDPNQRDGSDGIGGLNDYRTGLVVTNLTTQSGVLSKVVEPARTTAAIGDQITYRITVPAAMQTTDLNDVRILDDLNTSGADISLVGVTKISSGGSWIPGNTSGDPKNLVIEDTLGGGIDIPAGQFAVIDITVVLNDSASNTKGTVFTNTADYTYNAARDPGQPATSDPITIVEPDNVVLLKDGPLAMGVGTPAIFTLDVQNIGDSPAWDMTITDILPDLVAGGMCNATPIILTAGIFNFDGSSLLSSLTENTDFVTSFIGCTLTITMQSTSAAIDPTNRLIITYEASLDADSIGGDLMTNVAAATQWFSGDTTGAGANGQTRTFTGVLTDGTTSTDDEQDAHQLTVQSAVLSFEKTVDKLTAQPGETLRYTLTVANTSSIPLTSFSLIDELDALNLSPLFVPGSLTNIVASSGDTSNSDPNGGVNGTGLLDVRNLSLDGVGGADTVAVSFDVTLVPVINSTTVVLNQSQINSFGALFDVSDDPNVGGVIDPTETLITSAPELVVQKSSLDITGDPADLQPGDILRYTLTVKNIGNEDMVNVLMTDQVPANTTYVAGSTTLNAVAVADPAVGVSALTVGMLINAPDIPVAGTLRADADVAANNVATITFDVVVNASVVDGTVISNQGFVKGNGVGSGSFPLRPSDDPMTAAVDDPTIDVVGSVPFFDVQKTVALVSDANNDGIVDIGDGLRYTITATNFGLLPVTNTVFTDLVPADTSYVANSTTLNGIAVADTAVGVSPLIAGIDISSSDLTPPTAGAGMLVPGQSAFIEFEVVVENTAIAGTVISNQGVVSSNELPDEPTDEDGIDSNGDQPTEVTVGSAPLIAITKQVFVVGGGTALAGSELEYVVRVTNTGAADVTNVVFTDSLNLAQMSYVSNSALLDGLSAGITFGGNLLTADYFTSYGSLSVGDTVELRFRVRLDAGLNIGDVVTNTADVSWNIPVLTTSASVAISIGGTPGTASLNGQVWHDSDFSNNVGAGERLLQGWTVRLYSNNVLLSTTLSDVNGVFQFSGLAPNIPAGNPYELRYSAPGATATTALMGNANSVVFTDAQQQISGILAASGASVQNLNMPVQPNGVVYDSILRTSVAGVRLVMINQTQSNQPVLAACFDDPTQANQTTLVSGFYKFDLNFSDSRCVQGDEYEIQIQPLSNNFVGTTSVIIPPVNPVNGPAQDVINCPGTAADQIPATAQHCENSVSDAQPTPSVVPASINYALKFLFNNTPVRNQIFNNHIPIDPELGGAVAIAKVSGILNVTRSQLVPYTITITNTLSVRLDDLNVIDNYPAGFKYVAGSSRVDGAELEPQINDRRLTWDVQGLDVGESKVIKLLLIVGSGVGEGEYINTAQMINTVTNAAASGIASATVQVIPDPTFDCTDIIGKVFDDKNMNAYQDKGEMGLPGVQVATARGLRVTTDQHGRFHITCAVVPHEVRGSNFIMKLDDRTLPSGYRITSENPRVQRATRGKMLKFNFGAVIHRVVRLDLADGVFEKGSTELRPQWRSRIEILIIELQKDASILRLSYLGENETESEVADRLDAIEALISKRWEEIDCCYRLTIETEVFWRKGNPSDRKGFE